MSLYLLLVYRLLIFSRSALNGSRFALSVGQVAGLIPCKVCSVYVLHTKAVRNAYFSLQICHGVVDFCHMRKYEPN